MKDLFIRDLEIMLKKINMINEKLLINQYMFEEIMYNTKLSEVCDLYNKLTGENIIVLDFLQFIKKDDRIEINEILKEVIDLVYKNQK